MLIDKRSVLCFLFCPIFICVVVGQTPFPNASEIRKEAGEIFGAPIDANKNVFEVDKHFVIELLVYEEDQFVGFAVYPKYDLRNCNEQWNYETTGSEMSLDEYQTLLKKISNIQTIGHLFSNGKLGPVTNSRMFLVDRYSNSYVENLVYADYFAAHQKILAFNVYYMKRIGLTIEAKTPGRIKLGKYWYLGNEKRIKKSVIGKSFDLLVAGPLDIEKKGCKQQLPGT